MYVILERSHAKINLSDEAIESKQKILSWSLPLQDDWEELTSYLTYALYKSAMRQM